MRIVCPACAAEYDVPDARLTSNKMVRCSQCEGEWVAYPKAEDGDPEHDPLGHDGLGHDGADHADGPDPRSGGRHIDRPAWQMRLFTARDRLAASVERLPQRPSLIAAWVMTGVVVIGGMAATVTWRGAVVRAWPPSSRILGNVATATDAAAAPRAGTAHAGATVSAPQRGKAAE